MFTSQLSVRISRGAMRQHLNRQGLSGRLLGPHILAYMRGGLWGGNAVGEMLPTPSRMSDGLAEVAALKRTIRKRPRESHRSPALSGMASRTCAFISVNEKWCTIHGRGRKAPSPLQLHRRMNEKKRERGPAFARERCGSARRVAK